jgi:transcriptional regulator with XRE-family HTH domain
LTAYGKFLKKFRIDRNETLADMAGKLKISSAYLSSIENGTREIPAKMSMNIKLAYSLAFKEFLALIAAENATPRKVRRLPLSGTTVRITGRKLKVGGILKFICIISITIV